MRIRARPTNRTLVACLGGLALAALLAPGPAGAAKRPNLIVVMTDDQTIGQLRADTMPAVTQIFRDDGVEFTQAATQPLCCPSRAGLITGQYPHNNGVVNNAPGYRGLIGKRNTLPAWLKRVGYRTAFAGKFLNRYTLDRGLEPAPGYDDWFDVQESAYYGAQLSRDGEKVVLGDAGARNYVDNALTRHAVGFVSRSATRSRPFFLWLAYLAPHIGRGPHPEECPGALPVPAPRDLGAFAGEPLPQPPAFNEADVSDKPTFIEGLGQLSAEDIDQRAMHWRCSLESLGAVDRGVDRLVDTLRDAGEMKNTVLVFMSDNGYFAGEHRIKKGKGLPYEEAVRVPLLFHLPAWLMEGAEPGRSVDLPVAGIDIAPTLLRLARARPCRKPGDCRTLDGRSLLSLIRDEAGPWPEDRAVLTELEGIARKDSDACSLNSLRTPAHSYTEYTQVRDPVTHECVATDQAELYDLGADPFQLDNLLVTDPSGSAGLHTTLEARLDDLRRCSGIAGRDPLPHSGHHCE